MSSAGLPCSEGEKFEELRSLYKTWHGQAWISSLQGLPWDIKNQTGKDPCTWHGVRCNSGGEVTDLRLARNNLRGPLIGGFQPPAASNRSYPCLFETIDTLLLGKNPGLYGPVSAVALTAHLLHFAGLTKHWYWSVSAPSASPSCTLVPRPLPKQLRGNTQLPPEWRYMRRLRIATLELTAVWGALPSEYVFVER